MLDLADYHETCVKCPSSPTNILCIHTKNAFQAKNNIILYVIHTEVDGLSLF